MNGDKTGVGMVDQFGIQRVTTKYSTSTNWEWVSKFGEYEYVNGKWYAMKAAII